MQLRAWLLAALVFVTGAAALLLEVVLVRLGLRWFGSTVESSAAVVATFLLGLALGAQAFGWLASRSRRPLLLFAGAVACAAAAAFVAGFAAERLGAWLGPALPSAAGPARAVWLALGSAACALPPALFLGGTVAILTEALDEAGRGAHAALLAAANSAGAVIGVLLAGFVTLESLGVSGSAYAAAGLLAAAAAAAGLAERALSAAARAPAAPPAARPLPAALALAAALSGGALLAVEVLGTRLVLQFVRGSVFALAAVLAVFLAGLAAGNAIGTRLAARGAREPGGWLALQCAACALAGPLLVVSGERAHAVVGAAASGALLAAAPLLLPALAAGIAYAILIARAAGARRAGAEVGRLGLWSGVGSVAGSLATAFAILPQWGSRVAWLAASAAALAAALAAARPWKAPAIALVAGAAALAAGAGFADLRVPPRDPARPVLIALSETAGGTVAVMDAEAGGNAALYVDRSMRQGGGSNPELERRQGLLPLALRGDAATALVLGLGTGTTAGALLEAGVQSVEAVEVSSGVLDVLQLFGAQNGNLVHRPGFTVHRADAVAFARDAAARYDLVIGDLFFPWQDGAGALYSLEHFRAVRQRLAPGGLFCQWVPLHQMRFEEFGLVARTFCRAFPDALLFLADPRAPLPVVGMVGAAEALHLDPERIDAAVASPRGRAAFQAAELAAATDVLELYLGDEATIEAAFASARALGEESLVITLDRPLLEFRTARTGEPEEVLRVNNTNLLALHFFDALGRHLAPARGGDEAEAARSALDSDLRRRASAARAFLAARSWRMRAELPGEDRLQLEELEAEKLLYGIGIFPSHRSANAAAAELARIRLADGRYQQVLALGAGVLRFNPRNSEVAVTVGLAHLILGEPAAAAELLKTATEAAPDDAYAAMVLGIALWFCDNEVGARSALERAAELIGAERLSPLAIGIAAALGGAPELGVEKLQPLLEHPTWGVLARRAREKMEHRGE